MTELHGADKDAADLTSRLARWFAVYSGTSGTQDTKTKHVFSRGKG